MEFSPSANFPAKVSQLCRTRIIERDKIILRKSLQLNNRQKTSPPSTGSAWIAVPWIWRKRKDPSSEKIPNKRSSQRALERPKGHGRGNGNVPTHEKCPHPREVSPSTVPVPIYLKVVRSHVHSPRCISLCIVTKVVIISREHSVEYDTGDSRNCQCGKGNACVTDGEG